MIVSWLLAAGCAAGPLLPAANPAQPELPPPGLPNGVAAGDVTQASVVLWTRAATAGVVTFTLQSDTDGSMIGQPLTRTVVDPLLPVTVTVNGLLPQTTYRYQAQAANGDKVSGHFHTPAEIGVHRGLRFAASGDVRGDFAPYPSISNAAGRNLDFFVNLGDTIYAEFKTPAVPKQAQSDEEFRLKQDEVNSTHRGLNTLAALRGSTISFATLDDHEVLNNFAGGAPAASSRYFAENSGLINQTRLYRAGIGAFLAYQPAAVEVYGADADARMAGRPKLYRYRTFGSDGALFVLDMRSFRDEPVAKVNDQSSAAAITRFEQAAFAPKRTVLGADQMALLQHDLLDAQQRGITWKFVIVSDPIQELDMTAADDRWQGYAAERTVLLRFIAQKGIDNVVFITADIHGTVVNNLAYQEEPGGLEIPVAAWEMAVGPVAAYETFALAMFLTYLDLGMVSKADQEHYRSLPMRPDPDDLPNDRDDYVKALVNQQLARFGFNPIGLADAAPGVAPGGAAIDAHLLQGDYMVGHVYGWSEFDVDATTQALTVTTYGIPAYVASQMEQNSAAILAQTPQVVGRFVVHAKKP
jgi:phosphodiesterase/alkaline phosphatase D-like protein